MGLALPIMGGMVSQNVMNLVDTGMVGRLGKASLAAVGIASFATFFSQAFLIGLGAGVQAMASRRQGEGREDTTAAPLNGGLLLAVVTVGFSGTRHHVGRAGTGRRTGRCCDRCH